MSSDQEKPKPGAEPDQKKDWETTKAIAEPADEEDPRRSLARDRQVKPKDADEMTRDGPDDPDHPKDKKKSSG